MKTKDRMQCSIAASAAQASAQPTPTAAELTQLFLTSIATIYLVALTRAYNNSLPGAI